MKIRILETRNYTKMGLKHKGQVVDRPKPEALQYIAQGFAEACTERTVSRTMDEKSESVTAQTKEV